MFISVSRVKDFEMDSEIGSKETTIQKTFYLEKETNSSQNARQTGKIQ